MKETYGIQAVNEFLDYELIGGNVDWRLFAIKHGIIKQSTKTLTHHSYIGYDKKRHITLNNGRNQYILTLRFNDEELAQFRNN